MVLLRAKVKHCHFINYTQLFLLRQIVKEIGSDLHMSDQYMTYEDLTLPYSLWAGIGDSH